jgi:topoisomerase-4 subunit B
MYIGKLGDGAAPDDGIYILVKEIIDNSIDEFQMGYGKSIEIVVDEYQVKIRDHGRGIPLGKVVDVVSKINTGAKYDSKAFQKSVGLNGVGAKAVNALSQHFSVRSIREGQQVNAVFEHGILAKQEGPLPCGEDNGTEVIFIPDNAIFKHFKFRADFLENQILNYTYLNPGLSLYFNGERFYSKNGLLDLLERKTESVEVRYPIIHLKGEDIEVAFTHGDQYGEECYSFVNGQNTTQGGTHLTAFREAIVRTVRDFYNKNFENSDVRASIIAAVSLRVQEPVFESQTKTKLGSQNMSPEGQTVRTYVNDFFKKELDDYLHKNPLVADALLKRILLSEKERKDMAGVKKLAKERAKKANLHNKKLRDCRVHLTDREHDDRHNTTLFITEGDSASGSITKARDVQTQGVFSLRGKPLNCYGLKKKIVYQNEEFNLLQHALDIEEDLENLRFNRIVLATDADVDGMHIRLLLLTFFLQFFPDLVRNGHLYILDTPLFRVRNKQRTIYCYSYDEREKAIAELKSNPEITRFKGLGEISPDEFGQFIGDDMRLDPVTLSKGTSIAEILRYYMGKNTPERQHFIIDNLVMEKDLDEAGMAKVA